MIQTFVHRVLNSLEGSQFQPNHFFNCEDCSDLVKKYGYMCQPNATFEHPYVILLLNDDVVHSYCHQDSFY